MITVDDTTVATFTAVVNKNGTLVSPNFTPDSGELIVLCIATDSGSVGPTAITVSGGGLTWTLRATLVAGSFNCGVHIYTAIGAGAEMTITITRDNTGETNRRIHADPYLVSGHHATSYIGANATGIWDVNNKTLSLTTTGAGRLFGIGWDNNSTSPGTSTDIERAAGYASAGAALSAYKSADHAASETQGINFDAAGSTAPGESSPLAILEILAAGAAEPVTPDRYAAIYPDTTREAEIAVPV